MDFAKVKKIPILDIADKLGIKRNRYDMARCINPNHEDETQTMMIEKKGNYYRCFGCDIEGDGAGLVATYMKKSIKSDLMVISKWFDDHFEM